MNEFYERLIGFYKNGAVILNEDGTPAVVVDIAGNINRRVAEINRDLKRTKEIQGEYINKQMELREFVKTDEFKNMSWFKQEKVKKKIKENRSIINGIYIFRHHLKHEKSEIQKMHPKNTKKKSE